MIDKSEERQMQEDELQAGIIKAYRKEVADRDALLRSIERNCRYYMGCDDDDDITVDALARIIIGIIESARLNDV